MFQAAYSKIERGETEVKVSHLYQIAAVLKVSVYDLLPPAMENEVFTGDYLLKPVFVKVEAFFYRLLVRWRLKHLQEKLE